MHGADAKLISHHIRDELKVVIVVVVVVVVQRLWGIPVSCIRLD